MQEGEKKKSGRAKTCMVLQKIQFQAPSHLLFVAAASVAAPSGVVVQVAVAAHGPAAARLAALASAVVATCDTLAPRWARSSPPGWLDQAAVGSVIDGGGKGGAGTPGAPI
jgi:hypothetical protein